MVNTLAVSVVRSFDVCKVQIEKQSHNSFEPETGQPLALSLAAVRRMIEVARVAAVYPAHASTLLVMTRASERATILTCARNLQSTDTRHTMHVILSLTRQLAVIA